ncbi:MAG: G5 domain-containing protein [Anaerolineaceae bacterium]
MFYLFVTFLLAYFLASCSGLQQPAVTLPVTITADGKSIAVQMEPGLSVKSILDQNDLTLSPLDQVTPALDTLLTSGQEIKVIRVREEFEVLENTIPFERQTVTNESMPEGQSLLIQSGINGLQQVTFRRLFEDGVLVSSNIFKTTDISEPKPEIIMIGVQAPFSAIQIPGKIAYLSVGNAWLMDGSTGSRQPLVTSGDLDGRIFSLSPKANWLLFSRKRVEDPKEVINSLWIIKTDDGTAKPISLGIQNIVHHAAWVPDPNLVITYSTVEPRSTAPGWQANNDLQQIFLTANGEISVQKELIEANSGGIYGWWGTNFAWSPFGDIAAFAQPDRIGVINPENRSFSTISPITALQTRSDWAWVPNISWSRDQIIYTIKHASSPATAIAEQSPVFDLIAILPGNDQEILLAPNVGMFSNAFPSPRTAEKRYQVAYLQAVFPDQSETSRYHLMIMDQDGSNRSRVFPLEGSTGIEPQQVYWSPQPFSDQENRVALVYQGNLWLVNPFSHQTHQITGDGLINRISWE